ncbi:uncharacterized protein EAE97_011387 [Botrytis byssoidea]|uniref:Alpha/beta hydrolase fold-3 domain-containing protein n=1 Tax=Botrytis byssoidea TaxID=139641 RepID=A0A9P5HUV7_9HELO|nr:uncharacterized protein EAE97_011387 [Botrytis byssoidea]KAF7921119.1 hypothetical protein EAE97_011387 [Botrytis byssoidea]
MFLGQVSWLDIVVFLFFLTPQLIIHVGFIQTASCGLQALPFLLINLPLSFVKERFLTPCEQRSPFVQQASWFEDIVVRCVRYAFAYIPANIGRVFFSKGVALPFFKFRMFRHGYTESPIHWNEVNQDNVKGIWIIADKTKEPDIVIYYAHGGGFAMGSSYFYLEFLLAWLNLLKDSRKFRNPAIFALEYSLVPDESYPTQLHETFAGYKFVLSMTDDPSKICVSGDSAGATLILSLLLHIARPDIANSDPSIERVHTETPAMAVLISPWTTLESPQHKNTSSDYLDADSLHLYAHQYAGSRASVLDPSISPGACKDLDWWRMASPTRGFFITYGSEEVFAPETRDLIMLLKKSGKVEIRGQEQIGGIHAWPVAALFLSSTSAARRKGLRMLVSEIGERMGKAH